MEENQNSVKCNPYHGFEREDRQVKRIYGETDDDDSNWSFIDTKGMKYTTPSLTMLAMSCGICEGYWDKLGCKVSVFVKDASGCAISNDDLLRYFKEGLRMCVDINLPCKEGKPFKESVPVLDLEYIGVNRGNGINCTLR